MGAASLHVARPTSVKFPTFVKSPGVALAHLYTVNSPSSRRALESLPAESNNWLTFQQAASCLLITAKVSDKSSSLGIARTYLSIYRVRGIASWQRILLEELTKCRTSIVGSCRNLEPNDTFVQFNQLFLEFLFEISPSMTVVDTFNLAIPCHNCDNLLHPRDHGRILFGVICCHLKEYQKIMQRISAQERVRPASGKQDQPAESLRELDQD